MSPPGGTQAVTASSGPLRCRASSAANRSACRLPRDPCTPTMIRRTVGTATRLPNNPGRHDLRRRPATAYPDIQPLSEARGTVPNGTLAEPEATHMARSRSPDGGVDPELRGASDAVRTLVGADARVN